MYKKALVDETKDDSSYDVNIFKYSCQKKFLISLWFVIVLLLNEKPFWQLHLNLCISLCTHL